MTASVRASRATAPLQRWAEVDLGAVRHNVRALAALATPARLCAVVKADAYGHGAIPVAEAALAAGASSLAVDSIDEAVDLRLAGIDTQILVLSEPDRESACEIVEFGLTPLLSSRDAAYTLAGMVRASGRTRQLPVHLSVDTGLAGIGCPLEEAVGLSTEIAQQPELVLEGVCTHFAVADQPDHPFTQQQLNHFMQLLDAIRAEGVSIDLVHIANSAAALTMPQTHFDMIRCGSGIYGIEAAGALTGALTLRPALCVKARVTRVQLFPAGTRTSYGLRYQLPRAAYIATLPIGYAAGIPPSMATGGQVLIRGQRCPIAGDIMMDHLFVDVGMMELQVGDVAVLLGRQGDQEITVIELAKRLGTIADAIVCTIADVHGRAPTARSVFGTRCSARRMPSRERNAGRRREGRAGRGQLACRLASERGRRVPTRFGEPA
ncbi:MAG: alanine racemase [Actinobacteria bacterium]|nr:MAG: alanine racemase [Actinomycetota bacterium]